jgi:hypothetical protein
MLSWTRSKTEATAERRWSVVAGNLDRFARGEKLEISSFRPDRTS